jgi:peptidoglycan hydrolase-like amidase
VGLIEHAGSVRVRLDGRFTLAGEPSGGAPVEAGDHVAAAEGAAVVLRGAVEVRGPALVLTPSSLETDRFTVHDVTIGKDFHWQRRQSQDFQGALRIVASAGGLTVVNELPLEPYLASVISSEMSASAPVGLLEAHAVVARSWLLAQLRTAAPPSAPKPAGEGSRSSMDGTDAPGRETGREIRRWYDRESHESFDVCADDHCQRYQGVTRAFSRSVFDAVGATRGQVLVHAGAVCDARYSKCCGGMTEVFATAWADEEVPYLQAVYDGAERPRGFELPSAGPSAAEAWILSVPPAHCHRTDLGFLARVLPGFDQETRDFYRWEVVYAQNELVELLARAGLDTGGVLGLDALERGPSGRIRRLRVVGRKGTWVVGKELEIRRTLSRSHLLSSAFVARLEGDAGGLPERVRLVGAGWGHGVGLCQIGAASMADRGVGHREILAHYFRGAEIVGGY